MFTTLRNAFKIPELRKKLLFTLFILIIFRLGSHIPVPFMDSEAMKSFVTGGTGADLFALMDAFTGGAFSNATIFAMGITPYINASIIMNLLTVAIPALERLAKEGEEGRKKINQITRYTGIGLAFIQAAGLYVTLKNSGAVPNATWMKFFVITLSFTAGTAFIMWLGEKITEFGVGNGISLIIFAGIVSRIPAAVGSMFKQYFADGFNMVGALQLLAVAVIAVVAIAFVVMFNNAERRINVQYAKRVVGRKMYGGQSSNIPIKVAMAGVIPIIFASSIMAFPATIYRMFTGANPTGFWAAFFNVLSPSHWFYAVLYFLLIIFFTYFYTSIQFNPIEMSNNLKRNGGFIPGIRPGKPTSDFITKILNRVTLAGAVFLAIIAVLPILVSPVFGLSSGIAIGGTSLLIIEGVALETVKQIESQMLMRHYKGFLE